MKICPTCSTEYGDDQKFCPKDGTALRSTAQGSLVGSVIAGHHVEKKLGEGGMGAVYLGTHVKMGRKSAIKVMAPSMANDPEAIARFNREAANAARITHPNVCAIYDFGETPDGVIYLAMEFIEGESLGDLLEQEEVLPVTRAVSILQQTADALQAAHDLGIVHRDLKPDNIMLTRGRDGADVVKVVDFGIAKAMSGEEGQQVTKTGLVVGTPEYMSPEQLSGDVLDGRSDTYSLALVFFRMLTGAFPFEAGSAQEMMIKRLTDEPQPLNAVRPGANFPEALQQALDRALARMPADRFPGAVGFAEEAARAVEGWGPPTGEVTEAATQIIGAAAKPAGADATVQLEPTQVRPSQRTRTPGAAPAAPPAPTPSTPRPSVSPPRPKKKTPALAIAAVTVVVLGGGATAAVLLTGRGAGDVGLAPDSGLVSGDTAVTGNTAPGTPRTQESPRRAGGGGSTGPPRLPPPETTGTGGLPGPTLDPAAVNAEILRLGREVEDAGMRSVAMARAEVLFGEDLPDSLKAKAASVVADGYGFLEAKTDACLWIARAIRLDPSKRSYTVVRDNLLRCP